MAAEKVEEAGLHAIVIGVNNYPHLSTGAGPGKRSNYGRLDQLVSPALSAEAITRWLLKERNESQIRLRSLQMFASSPDTLNFDASGVEFACDVPTIAKVAKAIKRWKDAGERNADNVLLFYFCGHGFRFGQTDCVLLQDFGRDPHNHFKGALDVQGLLLGMRTCKAERQLYFFDACRKDMTTVMQRPNSCGETVINPTTLPFKSGRQIALWASTPGNDAYGFLNGRASVFAEGLIAAFRGAAAKPVGNGFEINTSRLKEAIDEYTSARGNGVDQVVHQEHSVRDFAIANLLTDPIVPVSVVCRDAERHKQARFSCALSTVTDLYVARRERPSEKSWDLDVETGQYDFTAHFDDADSFGAKNEKVQPPYRHVQL